MKNKFLSSKYVFNAVLMGTALALIAAQAEARDLVAASTTTVAIAKRVAQALSLLGIVAGGTIMQIPGASEFGKRTLIGGLVGALCSFGAPAFIQLMQSIFGTV